MARKISKADIKKLLPGGFKPVMELAGKLAFEKHEGVPTNFAFLVGTDAVWPAIRRVLSADIGIPDYYSTSEPLYRSEQIDDLDLLKNICMANFSLFKIFGVVGVFNTVLAQLVSICQLIRYSAEEALSDEAVIDLDDLFCFCLKEIKKITGENACIISTEGDGRVRVYAKSDLQFIWDLGKDDVFCPLPRMAIAKALNYVLEGQNNKKLKALCKVIRKISTTVGEGAMIILSKEKIKLQRYLANMEYIKPEWIRNMSIDSPKELHRAAFIMDGATFIYKENNTARIKPRYTTYPFQNNAAYGVMEKLDALFTGGNEKRLVVKKLSGKGSKTHGAANLSKLLGCKIKIVTISADGPIKVWPDELPKA
jgi:hypothetical protein